MDIRAYNRTAWNEEVRRGNPWTVPVGPEVIAAARSGAWEILLTPSKPVPPDWFGSLVDRDVLCLASGGGQQGPILAAAGARVTVFDNSPRQLESDRLVAEREGLWIATVEGDMRDLSCFADESFDLIVHPVSNIFVPEVGPVWSEAFRVLRPGGAMLAGMTNPIVYIFDAELEEQGTLRVCHKLPYSDLTSLDEAERQKYIDNNEPFEFSHTLEELIGGQLAVGFVLTGFYEDPWRDTVLTEYTALFFSTRAVKPPLAA